ncbi:MAG: M20/M25/M40 family metallo-hydrolase [bacterium]|nr:M20/M25/M40 family metallo-hydrolase [bacterium]
MTPEAVAESVDADMLVELLQQAIAIPSVTPHERDFARWAHSQLSDNAWDRSLLAPFDDARANVYARVGRGRPSLVLAGHLDTVHADDWKSHWTGTERADPFGATIIDREIWGRGSADQKAGICAILEALRAIRRSGCRPKGAVTALFVSDEESGQPGSGVSAGMKAAIADGEVEQDQPPDFLVYTEPTTSAIYTA